MMEERNDSASSPLSGELIRAWRKRLGLTQVRLAEKSGMSAAQLCHLERQRNAPSFRTLRRIAQALGISPAELVGDDSAQSVDTDETVQNESEPNDGGLMAREPSTESVLFSVASRRHRHALHAVHAVHAFSRTFPKSVGRQSAPRGNTKGATSIPPQAPSLFDSLRPATEKTREAMARTLKAKMRQKVDEYDRIEQAAGVPRTPGLPLFYPAQVKADDAEGLARAVRAAGGIAQSVLFDTISFFEGKGVHVIEMSLPESVDSLAMYLPGTGSPYIFLRKEATDERQQFRMAAEMANVMRCLANSGTPVSDAPADRRFAREFAAAFLMPPEAMQEVAYRLGRTPDNWTYELLLRVKQRFGVSAEAFVYRLEALDLLRSDLRQAFVRNIRAFYDEHGYAEPNPSHRRLLRHSRFGDLRELVSLTDKK